MILFVCTNYILTIGNTPRGKCYTSRTKRDKCLGHKMGLKKTHKFLPPPMLFHIDPR